jgi:hypothetical protein
MKKDTYDVIFARRLLKTKYFFQNLIGKDHFSITLYMIGSFFPALAARDRVNFVNTYSESMWIHAMWFLTRKDHY